MKKQFTFGIIIALIALVTGFAQAASTYSVVGLTDKAPAIRVKAGSEALTINIFEKGAAATNTVVVGSQSTTITGAADTTDTVAEFGAAILACTNATGELPLTVDMACSLSAASTDGELVTGAYTAAAGEWLEIPWSTADADFYSVYVPAAGMSNFHRGNVTVGKLFGNPTGTGNATVSVYIDGTWASGALLPEIYAYSNNTAAVELPLDIGINAFKKSVLVIVDRTTATTGNIGLSLIQQ